MKKLVGLFALLVLASIPAMAQDTQGNVGGGYTYRSWGISGDRTNMNGWNATGSFNVTRWLTAAADIDGTYANQNTADEDNGKGWIESYLFGPRIYPVGHHKLSPYAHALFGISHTSINFGEGEVDSDTAFAWEVGGGLDMSVTRHIGVRIAEFDYERTSLFNAGGDGLPVQDNFKYKAAILFQF